MAQMKLTDKELCRQLIQRYFFRIMQREILNHTMDKLQFFPRVIYLGFLQSTDKNHQLSKAAFRKHPCAILLALRLLIEGFHAPSDHLSKLPIRMQKIGISRLGSIQSAFQITLCAGQTLRFGNRQPEYIPLIGFVFFCYRHLMQLPGADQQQVSRKNMIEPAFNLVGHIA